MYIYPYKTASASARVLAESLNIKRIKHNNSRFRGRATKTVINWGSSSLPPEVLKCNIVNSHQAVSLASNKLSTFNTLKGVGVSIPEYTTNKEDIIQDLRDECCWLARTTLIGNSGAGIVIMESLDDLVDAPMYSKYIPKNQEYRIHVFNGRVISKQRKARSREVSDEFVNWKIRNTAGGFIFVRNEDHEYPQQVLDQAVSAVIGLGLTFGAVDVIWNNHREKAYVLEVNTAPGLSGTTIEDYVNEFRII